MSCVAPGCKSGYESTLPAGVTSHRFPKNVESRQKWIKAIPRANWIPAPSARICSLHFEQSDFFSDRQDSNVYRKKTELTRRRLKPNAVPHIFPNCPSYLSKPKPAERPTAAQSETRIKREIERTEASATEFLAQDKIQSFDELLSDSKTKFPPPWNIISFQNETKVVFEAMAFDDDLKPNLQYSLTITDTLDFLLVCDDVILPKVLVKHISPANRIERHSDVQNLLAFLKNYSEENQKTSDTITFCVKKLEELAEQENANEEIRKKLLFLSEQLKLSTIPVFARKYSSWFLCTALTWMKSSPSLYRNLVAEGLLTLPSTSHLKRLGSSFSLETGLSDSTLAYLRKRIESLSDDEKIISLIIDEVFFYYS